MATKTARRKRRASGTPTRKLDLKNMVSEVKNPLLIIGGLWIGSQVAKVLDKNVTPTVNGLLGLDAVEGKKMVTPIILTAGGLIASQMVPNHNVKMVSYGVAGTGLAILAKNMLRTNVFPVSGVEDYQKPIPGLGSENLKLDEFPIDGDDEPIEGTDSQEEDEAPIQ